MTTIADYLNIYSKNYKELNVERLFEKNYLNRFFDKCNNQKINDDNSMDLSETSYKSLNNSLFDFMKEKQISISTMTITAKLGSLLYIKNLSKYVKLTLDGIVSIKYGNRKDVTTNRAIITPNAKKKPSKKCFYNQATIRIKPSSGKNIVNIKIFRNGSIQMTGCKSMEDFYDVILKLIKIIQTGRKYTIGNKKYFARFVKHPEIMKISAITVQMINSNF